MAAPEVARHGDIVEREETLGVIADRQVIITDPLRGALEAYGRDHVVISTTKVTPFGEYLLSWREVNA